MQQKQNKQLEPFAKKLRRDMTRQERRLWYDFLSAYRVKFVRQKVWFRYILDFYCAKAKLVVELDGSQHYDEENVRKDAERTAFLETCGLRVIRFPNNDVDDNFEGVCTEIDSAVKSRLHLIPHPRR